VGLQLAALALREQPDLGHFLATFRGSHRYILDYLIEEVRRDSLCYNLRVDPPKRKSQR
jgi:ATP/maltotriose-dependent transcriptional regulator MalT